MRPGTSDLGHGLRAVVEENGRRRLETTDAEELARRVGEPFLLALCRCQIGTDRLMSMARFSSLLDPPGTPDRVDSERNRSTLIYSVCGTLHELASALNALRTSIRDLQPLSHWPPLDALAKRWNRGPYARVRNVLAFHFDEQAELPASFRDLVARANPLVLYMADSTRGMDVLSPLAYWTVEHARREILKALPLDDPNLASATEAEREKARTRRFLNQLIEDQTTVGANLGRLLLEVLRRVGYDIDDV